MKKAKYQGIKSYFKSVEKIPENRPNDLINDQNDNVNKATDVPEKTSNSDKLVHEVNDIAEQPNQPGSSFIFPKSAFGKQYRSCQFQWFKEYKWLEYDEVKDCVTCFVCKKHVTKLDSEKNKEEAFLSAGFRNWKKAITRFADHQKSKCHLTAVTFEVTIPICGNIQEMTNESLKAKMKENRQCLIKVIETLQFLGRQGLALRGDQNDENSNFMQLLKLRSKDFAQLKQWLEKKKEKYTSHDIQNEILILMANEILRNLADEIRDTFFATMCDEYTDISNKEQLTLCLRWIDELLDVHEDFLGFYEVKDIKSNTIVSAIRDSLLRMQISLDQ